MRKIWLSILFMLAVAWPAAARDLAVVTHRGNSVQDIALDKLVKICKGTTTKWADGTAIRLVIPEPASPGMGVALQKVFGMSAGEARALLQKIPSVRIVPNDQAAISTVENMPGAVALVDVYAISGKVNVVRIEGKLPFDPGYALHSNQ
jgi:periplasmic binding family protein